MFLSMVNMNDDLLAALEEKWLNGTISQEEMQLYAQWYNQQQNETVQVPEGIAVSRQEHQEKMWSEIEQVLSGEDASFISGNTPVHRLQKRRRTIYTISAAAAVIAVLLVSYMVYFTGSKVTKAPAVLADVQPGRSGLVLTLHNGTLVMLDTVKDGVVSELNGVKVIKENGVIRYEGEGGASQYNTAATNVGRRYQVQLPDNSVVWLNAGSELHYPLSFHGNARRVDLKGEAYFEVTHVKNSTPFIVKVDDVEVQVLGTSFNINAYENEPAIATTLLQGRVAVRAGSNVSVLNPNQSAVKARGTQQIQVAVVNANDAVGWVHNKFVFENMKLDEIMRCIERWYGIPVVYENGVNKAMVFSGATPMNANLSEVLKVLSLSGVHCRLEDNRLIVKP